LTTVSALQVAVLFNGIVHKKLNLSINYSPQVIPNLYDLLPYVRSRKGNIPLK